MRKHMTTVGRFWGYVSVFIALGVSLAGNVTAAYLHQDEIDPFIDPSWVDIGFAGLPPLAAFLVIELANHNPWKGTDWGPTVLKVLLWVIAPGSAIVSFIHLVTVVVNDRNTDPGTAEGILTWVTAVLTALLIDGLMFGGTAALLLPPKPVATLDHMEPKVKSPATTSPAAEPAVPLSVVPKASGSQPVLKASLARQPGQQRFKRDQHPLWDRWLKDMQNGDPWSSERLAKETKIVMGKDITVKAAAMQARRWKDAIS